jgi:hypothetical protein
MEQGTHLHDPAPGARVRVWGRGGHGSPRRGPRRPEGLRGRPQECGRRLAGGGGVDAGDRGTVVRGQGGGASYVCRRGVSLGKKREGGEGGVRAGRPGPVGCVRTVVRSDPIGVGLGSDCTADVPTRSGSGLRDRPSAGGPLVGVFEFIGSSSLFSLNSLNINQTDGLF